MRIVAYYVMEKFCICLFCLIARWCSFLVFMFQDDFVFHSVESINQNKVVYYKSFITFQIASHVCNFFKKSENFIELSKNRRRQITYRQSKAKYNYQNKLPKVNKNTSNYKPTSEDKFQNKLLKGNQKAIQQHFSQSLVQTCGNISHFQHNSPLAEVQN